MWISSAGQLANSSLVLDAANTYGAITSGFARGDQILLRNQTVTHDTWTENDTGTGGSLAIDYTTGGIGGILAQESFAFPAPTRKATFSLQPSLSTASRQPRFPLASRAFCAERGS
jgi:hypothetical protein